MRDLVFAGVALLCVVLGCSNEADQRTSDPPQTGPPTAAIFVRPLLGVLAANSVWSQNDDVDSLLVLLTDSEPQSLQRFSIRLFGRTRREGDGFPLPEDTVLWSHLLIDSSTVGRSELAPGPISGSWSLFQARPSELLDSLRAATQPEVWLDSVAVEFTALDGSEASTHLVLLWD